MEETKDKKVELKNIKEHKVPLPADKVIEFIEKMFETEIISKGM